MFDDRLFSHIHKDVTILIVEDEAISASDISMTLYSFGYNVLEVVDNAEEAVDRALSESPDLILMDIKLKTDKDGIWAAGQIKKEQDIPIIFLTAYVDEKTLDKAKETAPSGYLMKPYVERDLFATIEIALNKKEIEDKNLEKERWYSTILQSIGDGVVGFDNNTNVVFMNKAAEFLMKCNLESVFGKKLDERVEIFDIETGKKLTFEKIMSNTTYTGEMLLRNPENGRINVEYNCGLFNNSLHAKGRVLVIRDITMKKAAEESIKRNFAKLKDSMYGTIKAMAKTVETRDPYTAGHQKRVTNLAVEIAKQMDFDDDIIEGIQMAGIVHDLGKISVPAEILAKPGRLSEIEFELIKTHSQVGYDILNDIEFPWPIANIIYQHHEKINGSGYPNNLSGSEITIESKIISVADVVEAMASHRPYRPALGLNIALEEIKSKSGSFFDKDIVAICEQVVTSAVTA